MNPFIPDGFTDAIFKQLDEFDTLSFFRWDLPNDKLTLEAPMESPVYDLFPLVHEVRSFFLKSGFIYEEDRLLLENYLAYLDSQQEKFRNATEHTTLELRLRSASGESYIWSEVKLLTYFDDTTPVVIFGLLRDIHARKEQQLFLLHQAEHDPLTQFYNKGAVRRYVSDYLRLLPASAEGAAMLIIDADDFKYVNDSFGHLFGDAVLTDMALAIENNFRHSDIFGRIGGDEFIVFLKEIASQEAVKERCQRLIEDLKREYNNETEKVAFSISAGIAFYPQHGTTFDELFKHADRALYEAKSNGRCTYRIYKPSLLSTGAPVSLRKNIDTADMQQKAFKDNMLEFIFRLLYETKNPEATISVTLGLLGKQFNLDRVAIDVKNPTNNTSRTVYEWLSPLGYSRKDVTDPALEPLIRRCHDFMLAHYRPTPLGLLTLCADTAALPAEDALVFKALGIRSFAHSKISRGSVDIGCLSFECARQARTFSEEELNYLNIFTGILGSVLLPPQTDASLRLQNQQFKDIINHLQEYIYIVDRDTHELVFFNESLRQALPEIAVPQPCYNRMHHLDEPCPDCPLPELSANGAEYLSRILYTWGSPTPARAINIDWEPGRHTCLIAVEPNDTHK